MNKKTVNKIPVATPIVQRRPDIPLYPTIMSNLFILLGHIAFHENHSLPFLSITHENECMMLQEGLCNCVPEISFLSIEEAQEAAEKAARAE